MFYSLSILCLVVSLSTMCNISNSKSKIDLENVYFDEEADGGLQNNQIYINSFKTYYFYNMVQNYGRNQVGSCGYVAMAMLLSYYDTFWNDSIVPESYEINSTLSTTSIVSCASSPGSLAEAVAPSDIADTTISYYPYKYWLYSNYYSTSLHAKLIIDQTGLAPNVGPGVGPTTFESVFTNYFNSIGFEDYEYSRSPVGASSSEVKAWVINKIVNEDTPVILGRAGHVTIAYDYDSALDRVYVHNGWLGSPTHEWFNYDFDDAHSLSFSCNHSHSYHYNLNGTNVCHCQLSSHVHKIKCRSVNSLQHQKTCYCGYNELEDHSLYLIQTKPRRVYACREECGYVSL